MYLAKNFIKQVCSGVLQLLKLPLMFFLPFSESYKLTRKNPNMLRPVNGMRSHSHAPTHASIYLSVLWLQLQNFI